MCITGKFDPAFLLSNSCITYQSKVFSLYDKYIDTGIIFIGFCFKMRRPITVYVSIHVEKCYTKDFMSEENMF